MAVGVLHLYFLNAMYCFDLSCLLISVYRARVCVCVCTYLSIYGLQTSFIVAYIKTKQIDVHVWVLGV